MFVQVQPQIEMVHVILQKNAQLGMDSHLGPVQKATEYVASVRH